MAKKSFTVILAVDNDWGIGKNGGIPWRLKGDMEFFKSQTTAGGRNAVIMGRLTYLSLPEKHRPLPGRLNIVLTREQHAAPFGQVLHANSLDEALIAARAHAGINEVFVIGGSHVYAAALAHPECGKVVLTSVGATYGCTVRVSGLAGVLADRFQLQSTLPAKEESGLTYVHQTYVRKQ